MPGKTHSAVKPTWYFLDEIQTKEGMPALILRINWNIENVEVQEPMPHTEWQYDSVIMEHKPALILEETDIRSYIETHETELKASALRQWNAEPVIGADITEVRNQPLIPLFEERIFNEKEVYGATITEIDTTRSDKRYIKAKLLNRNVTKWCYVTGSVYRDYTEAKINVGDTVVILHNHDNRYPVVIDRVVL